MEKLTLTNYPHQGVLSGVSALFHYTFVLCLIGLCTTCILFNVANFGPIFVMMTNDNADKKSGHDVTY